jgi:hypothetical protein
MEVWGREEGQRGGGKFKIVQADNRTARRMQGPLADSLHGPPSQGEVVER